MKPYKKNTSRRGAEKEPSQQEINMLVALFNQKRYAEMEAVARKMTVHFPNHGIGWKAMGTAILQQGRNEEALVPLQRASELSPGDAQPHNNLGNAFMKLDRLHEAEASYRQALKLNPGFVEAYGNLGDSLHDQGRLSEAETSYRRALEIFAEHSEALVGLGRLRMENGQMEEAEDLFLQALRIKPYNMAARLILAHIKKIKTGDANFAALVKYWEAAQNNASLLSATNAISLHFALGKCYDDTGDYEKAFPHFLEGCKLKRATLNYSHDQSAQEFAGIMRIFDRASIDRLRGAGNPSRLPIFVLGMPRSGTTLTEQIIASHPDVYGAGELPDMLTIARRNNTGTGVAFPENMLSLDQVQLVSLGAEYIFRLQQRAPSARHITDKMPANFLAIGLIHLMLPNAKIIHVNRNPVDTCLSCFTQLFTRSQEYTYDLTELGKYYVGYARLMEHWRNVLPAGAILDVNYEDIVANKEAQARRMIEYCGLEWDEACLDFHKNERPVLTASVTQVRQPTYKSSMERWRHYEKFLSPLLDALGGLAPKH